MLAALPKKMRHAKRVLVTLLQSENPSSKHSEEVMQTCHFLKTVAPAPRKPIKMGSSPQEAVRHRQADPNPVAIQA
jgi:hypothetical protein